MDITTGLLLIGGVYIWALFLDRFLKSCSHYGYIQFLRGTGLEIKFLHFKWTTAAFNKLLLKWGSTRTNFLNYWFNLGLVASLILLPIAIYLLLLAFFQNFSSDGEESIIQPALPGVNLPASELGYYSATLLLSSLIHELGHALAAVREDVNLNNVGLTVMFVLPVAYVDMNSDRLFSLNPWKQLKILCAGIWHNLFISLVAYLLFISLPYVFSPLYDVDQGVIVTNVNNKSPLGGPRGFSSGDKLMKMNDCDLKNEESWFQCLSALQLKKPAFCLDADIIHNLDESVPLKHSEGGQISCCNADNQGKLCFEYLDAKDSILELPQFACLPGRSVIEVSKNFCSSHPHSCPSETFCFKPILANNSNLFKIKRFNRADVIYIGVASDFAATVVISSYIPKYSFLGTAIPDIVTKFLKYVIVFSTGLAILNVLPCMYLDGQHILNTLFYIIFSKHLRTTHIRIFSGVITAVFSVILLIHCVVTISSKVSR